MVDTKKITVKVLTTNGRVVTAEKFLGRYWVGLSESPPRRIVHVFDEEKSS